MFGPIPMPSCLAAAVKASAAPLPKSLCSCRNATLRTGLPAWSETAFRYWAAAVAIALLPGCTRNEYL